MVKVTYRKRKLFPLFAKADEEKAAPILDVLKAKGFPIAEAGEAPNKRGVMLLFLSDRLRDEPAILDTFFANDAKGVDTVPVSLDGSTPPELLKNALYSRNTIFADRYSTEELAERIATAKPFETFKKPLPIILIAAAAVLVIVGTVLLLTKLLPAKETIADEPEITPAPTAVPVIPAQAGLLSEDLEKVYELIIIGDTLNYFTGKEGWVARQGWARVGAEYYATHGERDGEVRWYDKEDGHEIETAEWNDLDFLRYMKNVKFITLVRVKGTLPDLSGLEKLDNVELFECDIADIEGLRGTRILHFGYSGNTLTDFSPLNACTRLDSANFSLFDPIPQDLSSLWAPNVSNVTIDTDSSAKTVDLSGLKSCNLLYVLRLDSLSLTDLTCLAECKKLRELELVNLPDLRSLDGLQDHQRLTRLFIDYQSEDLKDCSALSDNTSLRNVELHNAALNDLSWLSNAKDLEEVSLWDMNGMRNLHGLEDHTKLRRIYIQGLRQLTDLSALSSCTGITEINMSGVYDLADISPIVKLPKLSDLRIYGSSLHNVDFLWDIVNKHAFSFGIAEVPDWSGLEAIKNYSYLNVTDRSGSALPYLRDAKIRSFELWCRSGINNWSREPLDWSQFPTVSQELRLHGVVSLEGMPELSMQRLIIDESQLLTSLDGISNLLATRYGTLNLEITGCPRLTDWSALSGLRFNQIYLDSTFTLPDFSTFEANQITLCTPVDLYDLHCFDGMDPTKSVSIELIETNDVKDLTPLYAIKNGNMLKVPAHLQEQAQLLVESGNFRNYEVRYPDEWWHPAELHVELLSLDDLDTLPSAVLKRVDRLCMVGDVIFSWDDYRLDQQWDDDGNATFTLRSNDGDESRDIVVEAPGTLTDFSKLAVLTGLEEISLFNQSFPSLDGAQNLEKLWKLEVSFTPTLTDASAAFTLQNLEELRLQYTGVTSLQGVQNLTRLRWADFNGLQLDDLAPLAGIPEGCNFTFDFPLMTVDAFLALPEDVLNMIEEIAISGNYVHTPWGDWQFETDWGARKTYLHCGSTGERIPCEVGPITDLNGLPVMQNLRNLVINRQPITNLNGLEKQPNMFEFRMQWCPGVTDVSLLFTLPQIESISVRDSNVTSLAGIGALPHLIRADFGGGGVPIHTLSWLSEIDFTYAETPDGNGDAPHFDLSIDWWNLKDDAEYRYLALVPEFSYLNLNGHQASKWLDVLKDKKIGGIGLMECNLDNETFKAFIEQHPELTEINMPNNPRLTDISILLTLPNLRYVWVSDNMRQAIDSLGDLYGFRLEYN